MHTDFTFVKLINPQISRGGGGGNGPLKETLFMPVYLFNNVTYHCQVIAGQISTTEKFDFEKNAHLISKCLH